MIKEPRIVFSEWVPWAERHRLKTPGQQWMGLYLWARFPKDARPTATDRPYPKLPKQLIYVGETKNLNRRALTGWHHRLAHHRDTFGADGLRRLYVSVARIRQFRDDDACIAIRVFTQYIEARINWEFAQQYHKRPALLYKKARQVAGTTVR